MQHPLFAKIELPPLLGDGAEILSVGDNGLPAGSFRMTAEL
jgi:hypothetical protein